ncbi:hypothetical protein N8Z19_00325 [Saprospiraceae bacterium]|nr:hypothetical protein [Saprospiraceae bacterium]
MTHNYTPELLIKYVYGEADIVDRLELEYGLENNAPLRAQYLDILNSYRNVPKVAFSPKKSILDNILNYSKSTLLETNF